MPNRVVLIPFPEAASFEAVVGTRGGNLLAKSEDLRPKLKEKYYHYIGQILQKRWQVSLLKERDISIDYLACLLLPPTGEGVPDKISALERDPSPKMQEIARVVAKYKSSYDRETRSRANAIVPIWNKVDAADVVCADSKTLAGALAKLKSRVDTLYIHGHCASGSHTLQSADHKINITVEDLIEILKGKLNRKFAGKIKIFACQSALDTQDSDSFAKTFATKLSKKGWVNCTFYGYTERLSAFKRDVDGHKITDDGNRASLARSVIQVPTQHASSAMQ
jgi:hypothetical protein